MAVFRVFVCLLASAASLKLQGDAPVDLAHLTCQLPIALPVAALNLADDEVLDNAVVVATPKGDALAQKQQVLQDAMVDYKQKKQAFQLATNNLMAAMETLLEVPSADASMLEQVAGGKTGKDALVVFYAPWCPHCKAFVTSENSPLKAISASLEKAGGPKVVTFDMIASSAPISIDAVPTIYLFKTSGEAVMFEDDTSNLEALMAFALDKPKAAASLLAKKHELHLVAPHRHHTLASWQCPLENCVLKSPLAQAGPAFADGVRFFAVGSDGKDTRAACPFGGKNFDGEASKEEYLKYMKGLDKVGDMSADQRREWAIANQARWIEEEANEEAKPIKAPTIDITKPGAEAVNSKQWAELRNANTYDMLITFHAHWCPHCKSFVKGANAPIQALSESLEQASGAKVVSFEITESTPPLSLEAVPAVYLFKTSGEAVPYEGNPMDLDALMAWTLDNASAKKQALVSKEVVQHLRGPA